MTYAKLTDLPPSTPGFSLNLGIFPKLRDFLTKHKDFPSELKIKEIPPT